MKQIFGFTSSVSHLGLHQGGKMYVSDLLKVNLAKNIIKLEKLTLAFVLGHKHV